jgi:transposase
MSPSELARKYRVRAAWVRRLRQRWRETGQIGPKAQRQGPTPSAVKFAAQIREAGRQAPDPTLDDYRERFGLPMSRATLARALSVLGRTRK